MQAQEQQDGAVKDLVGSLRELLGVASACPNLAEVGGTIDVIEEIGRVSLEAARIVHDYVRPSVKGKASITGI